ncbi:hypothetical protein MKW94_015540 [Papaver nudicaule]|uniref:Ribosomal protein L15 n=1 Tax=Papaver nudicaule TaxID=74823 RepID=A0AA41V9V0_PAPNU|nr:hypothetical protein [Papaver nudicaule]
MDAFLLEYVFRNAEWSHLELSISRASEELICRVLRETCKTALSKYATTIEELTWPSLFTTLLLWKKLFLQMQDSTYKYFEIILVDAAHNAVCNDPRINWICNTIHKHRELLGRGHLNTKARPSRRATWKTNSTVSLPRYR